MKYVIIGASGGIGKEILNILSVNPGSNLIATYNQTHLAVTSTNVQTIKFDVLSNENPFTFLQNEPVDGLVYCPGAITLKPFDRLKTEDFFNDYQLQFLGAVKTIQYLLPNLKKSRSASVVLFSTVAAGCGMNFHSLVASTKAALEGLTRSLAAEFAPKIRFNAIAPSLTKTPLAHSLTQNPERASQIADKHPLKRLGEPSDIAELAVFLLSDKSSWVTGQIIHADGGMSSIR
jgi:NAD(P)-dependent dehydrogenase (short-subunit alcohol dehydrogenase family)